jgi:radical SAM superfamily enzyme YgiQ (UPF0313 family)
MNKILLIGINARYSHPAMALYYLREYVRDLPWDVLIREFTIHTPVNDILRCIEDEKPRAVAFSVYIWNTGVVQEVLRKLEQIRDRPSIVLGGPDAGYNSDKWFTSFSFINYIIPGHGEEAFRSLLTGSLMSADGLNPEKRVLRIENPPFSRISFPYTDTDLRAFEHRKIYYESSRGCIFKCAYCLSARDDQHIEFREFGLIKDELALIMKYRPQIIKFVDRTFNAKKIHAHSVWEHIINTYSDAGTRFHFEVHPALLDQDDFILLKNCPRGLFQFELGIQSTFGPALRAVNRKGDWETIMPRIKQLIGMKTIPVHIDLIAGLPFEDYDTLAFSFNEAYALRSDHFQLGYLKVLPGTEAMEQAEEWGLKYASKPPYEVIENRWLSADNMKKIKTISKLVDVIYNSHRFERTLENLLLLHSSPFNLFEELACAAARKVAADTLMQWEYLAGILIDCALAKQMEQGYILDCLRWDWCASSAANRLPKMLKTDAARKKRKEFLARLKERSLSSVEIDKSSAMRSSFFVPETALFREKYLNRKQYAIFLPDGIVPLFME